MISVTEFKQSLRGLSLPEITDYLVDIQGKQEKDVSAIISDVKNELKNKKKVDRKSISS